jgi:hypothetical protein
MRVFISYRREDTASAAGRLYDRLSNVLSKKNVFFDVSAIKGGENFAHRIEAAIAGSSAALIFIGDKWLATLPPSTTARIWEPDDYVRAEVRGALAHLSLVLPILVAGAKMPKADQLPEDISEITIKNAMLLRHETFDDDVENILSAVVGDSARERPWESRSFWAKTGYAIAGTLVAVALTLLVALAHFWIMASPLSESIGEMPTALGLPAIWVLGGVLGWLRGARRRTI